MYEEERTVRPRVQHDKDLTPDPIRFPGFLAADGVVIMARVGYGVHHRFDFCGCVSLKLGLFTPTPGPPLLTSPGRPERYRSRRQRQQ